MAESELLQWLNSKLQGHLPPQAGQAPRSKYADGQTLRNDGIYLNNLPAHVLFSTDSILDGVHFKSGEHSPEEIARKALNINLSDIASEAAHPLAFNISLTVQSGIQDITWLKRFYESIFETASNYGLQCLGGDTNSWKHPFHATITIIGQKHSKGPFAWNHSRPGDRIYVTGGLGKSLLGHHLSFKPRIEEAKFLADHITIHSMSDISDGLIDEIRSIASSSALGASIDASLLPKSGSLIELGLRDSDQIESMLCDGEDFELCFTSPEPIPLKVASEFGQRFPDTSLTEIGFLLEGSSIEIENDPQGRNWNDKKGYEHRF